jgi:hypothetical protein
VPHNTNITKHTSPSLAPPSGLGFSMTYSYYVRSQDTIEYIAGTLSPHHLYKGKNISIDLIPACWPIILNKPCRWKDRGTVTNQPRVLLFYICYDRFIITVAFEHRKICRPIRRSSEPDNFAGTAGRRHDSAKRETKRKKRARGKGKEQCLPYDSSQQRESSKLQAKLMQ